MALWGDGPAGIATRARQRRLQLLVQTFPDLSKRRVLDLGGSPGTWRLCPTAPASVCCVNLDVAPATVEGVEQVVGDATTFSEVVDPRDFDLIYSNSVLEHLGGALPRRSFANAIMASGLPYWVQAPYRHFPLEPHWTLPFWQYVPRRWQVPWGGRYRYGSSSDEALARTYEDLAMLDLPNVVDMRYLFPGAEVLRERLFGLTKSLVAVSRTGGG